MSAPNLLITGATGLVGQNFAPRAVAAGYNVLAMVRRNSDRSALAGLPVRFVEGDLGDPETLPAAVAEADIVVHAAAHLGDWAHPNNIARSTSSRSSIYSPPPDARVAYDAGFRSARRACTLCAITTAPMNPPAPT